MNIKQLEEMLTIEPPESSFDLDPSHIPLGADDMAKGDMMEPAKMVLGKSSTRDDIMDKHDRGDKLSADERLDSTDWEAFL